MCEKQVYLNNLIYTMSIPIKDYHMSSHLCHSLWFYDMPLLTCERMTADESMNFNFTNITKLALRIGPSTAPKRLSEDKMLPQ